MGNNAVMANLRAEFGDDPTRGTILLTYRHPDPICGAPRLAGDLGWPVVAWVSTAPILIAGDETGSGLTDAQSKGAYLPDMRLDAWPAARMSDDGDALDIEGFSMRTIRVRGRSADSFTFLFEYGGRRCLIAGDIVFYGGGLVIGVLFPVHGLFTLAGGQRHIDTAQQELVKGFVPRCIGQGGFDLLNPPPRYVPSETGPS